MRFEVIYPQDPAEVWQSLTDPDEIAVWLMQNDFRPEIGHEFTFRTKPAPGFDGVVYCRVLELIPEKRLVYSWNAGPHKTTVTWTLEPYGEGTRLTLRHEGFRGIAGLVPQIILGRGWSRLLRQRLPAHFGRRNATDT